MIEEINKLELRKEKLIQNIEFSNQKKQEIIDLVQDLLSQYNSQEITRQQYQKKLNKALENRTAEQWVKYYDDYISYYNYQINLCDRLIKQEIGKNKEQSKENIKKLIIKIIITLILLVFIITLIFIFKGNVIGFVNKISSSDLSSIKQSAEFKESKLPINLDRGVEIKEESLTQYQAVVGQPVKWKKKFTASSSTGFSLELPEDSQNVKINSITDTGKQDITKFASINEKWIGKEIKIKLSKNKITGNVVSDNNEEQEFEIIYETPGPIIEVNQKGERTNLKITSPDDVHYKEIVSFANIPETLRVGEESKIKLYQTKTNGIANKQEIQISAYDSDENGMIDYVKWITPYLSDWEGYIIIKISKAEHLDSNKENGVDIYDEVSVLDGVYSPIINENEYVRVTFEQELDNTKDITVYPKIVNGTPRIEVYEINKTAKIAEFSNLQNNEKNKIFLTNLQNPQNTFDLKIVDGSIEIDYIIDPVEFFDDFYEVYDTDLEAHIPDIGDGWTQIISRTKGTEDLAVAGGDGYVERDTGGSSDGVLYQTDNIISKADYEVTIGIDNPDNLDDYGIIAARIQDENNMYALEFNAVRVSLWVKYLGAWKNLDSQDNLLLDESGHTVYLNVTGTKISAGVDEIEYFSEIEESISNPGRAGLGMGSIITSTADMSNQAYTDFTVITKDIPDIIPPYFTNLVNQLVNLGKSLNYNIDAIDDGVGLDSFAINWTSIFSIDSSTGVLTNISTLIPGQYAINISINDTLNNLNSAILIINVAIPDLNAPDILITAPANNTNSSNNTLNINYIISDLSLDSCWYSNDTFSENTTLLNCADITNIIWAEGQHNVIIWANDSLNQENSSSVSFKIDTINPDINITFPINNFMTNDANLNINYTVSDANLNSCKWSNDFGITNITLPTCTNITTIIWSQEQNNIIVWANDSIGNENSSSITFNLDITPPNINFIPPTPKDKDIKYQTNIFTNITSEDSQNRISTFIDFNKTLVGWWRMDAISGEGVTVYDNSNYGNNGSITGPSNNAHQVLGHLGKAMDFDRDSDLISIPHSETLNLTSNFTISLWVKPIDPTNSADYKVLINKGNVLSSSAGGSYSINYMERISRIYFNLRNANNKKKGVSTSINPNIYTNIFITLDNGVMNLYKNSILDSSTDLDTQTINTNNGPLAIGSLPDGSLSFRGEIDDIIILERVLSQQEISALYANNQVKYIENNFTNLPPGNYTIKAYSQDTLGNINSTEERAIELKSQSNPLISYISQIPNTMPNEASFRPINFNLTVYDADGFEDINFVQANFSKTGYPEIRQNSSCSLISSESNGNYANYTCTIDMWYFDEGGDWNITVYAEDNEKNNITNDSTTFYYVPITGIVIDQSDISFDVNTGEINRTVNSLPIIINNTGNTKGNITIRAINLHGNERSDEYIDVGNFSVGANILSPAGCDGVKLQNNTERITKIFLNSGNLSIPGTEAQVELFYCINLVPSVSTQAYSTNTGGSWIIGLLAIAIAIRKKPKKDIKKLLNNYLIKSLNLLSIELQKEFSEEKQKIIKLLIKEIKKKYKLNNNEITELIETRKQITIPITIFSKQLGGLEAVCKYLKENLNMNYKDVSELLNKNERTIWTAYNKAKKKDTSAIKIQKQKIQISISIFQNKNLTVLESLTISLKQKGLNYKEIAELLNRDQRNIWTIHSQASKKHILNKRNI